MFDDILSIKIGGMAGQGIKSAGLILAKTATRSGYNIYDYTEYPSLIRGGHNIMQICISKRVMTSPVQKTDLLVALNQQTIDLHFHELTKEFGILCDEGLNLNFDKVPEGVNIYQVPLAKLAIESGGKDLLSNTVALGAVMGILGGDLGILTQLIEEEFSHKSDEVRLANRKAATAGYEFVKGKFKLTEHLSPLTSLARTIIVTGNEACALGAIAAGMQFTAIYPMSPITNMLHTLAQYQEQFGYIYKQPEDEIAAIIMSLGASYGGARAFTTTSGGGFSLMVEGYGLAGMIETPIVIVNGMRGGPATGLPTWTEQGDLRFALHAHQGDFPRIVLAAGDAKEAFDLTMQAFNLADKYQTPVMILIDKNICENDQSFPEFNISKYVVDRGKFTEQKVENYERFADSPDGISLRSRPGVGNFFVANSDEHLPSGLSTEESSDRIMQMNKRMRKLDTCRKEDMEAPKIYGPEKAKTTLISWGSNKGGILEAIQHLKDVNYLHITWMNPLPVDQIKKVLESAENVIDIECNFSGQLAGIIREQTGFEIKHKLLKYDGRPIYPEEIIQKVKEVLN